MDPTSTPQQQVPTPPSPTPPVGPVPTPQPASQPTAPQPVSLPKPKLHMMGKIPMIVVGIIILLAALGGAYYLGMTRSGSSIRYVYTKMPVVTHPASQNSMYPSSASAKMVTPSVTPDPTASWKVFTSQKYGYSIKYPTGLTPNEQDTYYHYVEFKDPTATGSLPAFVLSAIPTTFTAKDPAAYNYMSSDWIGNLYTIQVGETKTMDQAANFTRLPDITVDGQTALVIEVTATGYKQHRVYIKANGNYYMISNYYQPSSDLSTFQDFLSSFTLTAQ